MLVKTSVAAKAKPTGVLTDVTDKNQQLVAVTDVQPGEYVLEVRFGTTPSAIPVSLSDPDRVGTFVTPGSHVVIYDTFQPPVPAPAAGAAATAAAPAQTRVLLEDVLVIAVGNTSLTPVAQGQPAPVAGRRATHRPRCWSPSRSRPRTRHASCTASRPGSCTPDCVARKSRSTSMRASATLPCNQVRTHAVAILWETQAGAAAALVRTLSTTPTGRLIIVGPAIDLEAACEVAEAIRVDRPEDGRFSRQHRDQPRRRDQIRIIEHRGRGRDHRGT